MDITNAVKGAKGGSVEFRAEKAGIIQAGVGKASFTAEKLVENIMAFADAVQKSRPAGAKGHFINRVAISSTMGPGVKVEPGESVPGRSRRNSRRYPTIVLPGSVPGIRVFKSNATRLDSPAQGRP